MEGRKKKRKELRERRTKKKERKKGEKEPKPELCQAANEPSQAAALPLNIMQLTQVFVKASTLPVSSASRFSILIRLSTTVTHSPRERDTEDFQCLCITVLAAVKKV